MQLVSHRDVVGCLVELLKFERDRPPEFQDGGAAARAWAIQVRDLDAGVARPRAGHRGRLSMARTSAKSHLIEVCPEACGGVVVAGLRDPDGSDAAPTGTAS